MAFTAFVFSLASCLADPGVKTGGDRDEHGCIGSAGYTWSPLRKKCIRVWEEGIRLSPKHPSLDQTQAAYVVFVSADVDVIAELHITGSKMPLELAKPMEFSNKWAGHGHGYKLTLKQGMYTLEDSRGQVLYQGPAAR